MKIELSSKLQQTISVEIAKQYKVIPKDINSNEFHLWKDEFFTEDHIEEELSMLFGKKIVLYPTSSESINRALSEYYFIDEYQSKGVDKEKNFIDQLIQDAKIINSSDIHIEIYESYARVRMRVDGKLIERFQIDKTEYSILINQIKVRANLLTEEQRLPQDGRISYRNDAFNFDLRVSTIPTIYGEKVVMRILGKGDYSGDITKLGLTKEQLDLLLKEVQKKEGIILISGPTGSGKTTTLYALISHLNSIGRNITTIEDPIEYILEGINQVQLNEPIGLTFPIALKSFLRQDPNILMVGEIRDLETAKIAIRTSLTGHIVLSTIHTNSAKETPTRLIDIGIEPFSVASTLNLSIAQRLVRKLCENCKIISIEETDGVNIKYKSNGCNTCHYTGYKGRIAIFEIMPVSKEIASLIRSNSLASQSEEDLGYISLKEQAMDLVLKGLTSTEEVFSIIYK